MRYLTGEKIPFMGFQMEVQMKNELFLPQITQDFYTIILFTGSVLQIESFPDFKNAENLSPAEYSGCGLLVLAPDHGIKNIAVKEKSPGSIFQTLIFSPFGLNVNNKKFPETYEYEFLNNLKSGYAYVALGQKLLETFISNFENINFQMNVEQGHLWPCIARSYISEMVILLTRNQMLNDASQKEGKADSKINQIVEFFQYSYSQKITLDDVSKKFATNRTTLNSMFNQVYGVSAIAFLNKMRIQNASLMLTNTAMPISDIAERTGFADEAYFSRAYKKMTGKSPSEYRLSIPHPQGLTWPDFATSV